MDWNGRGTASQGKKNEGKGLRFHFFSQVGAPESISETWTIQTDCCGLGQNALFRFPVNGLPARRKIYVAKVQKPHYASCKPSCPMAVRTSVAAPREILLYGLGADSTVDAAWTGMAGAQQVRARRMRAKDCAFIFSPRSGHQNP